MPITASNDFYSIFGVFMSISTHWPGQPDSKEMSGHGDFYQAPGGLEELEKTKASVAASDSTGSRLDLLGHAILNRLSCPISPPPGSRARSQLFSETARGQDSQNHSQEEEGKGNSDHTSGLPGAFPAAKSFRT